MPKVPQYGASKVDTQLVRGPTATPNPLSDDYQNIQSIGRSVSNVADAYVQMRKKADILDAEDALTDFERERNNLLSNPETGYFNLQGRDAYDRAGETRDAIAKLQSKYSEGLASASARNAFANASRRIVDRTDVEIAKHSTMGLNAWETATAKAQVENTLENATLYWNDPKNAAVQRELGRQVLIETLDRQGIDGIARNEQLQNFDSAFATNQVEASLRAGSAQAEEVFKRVKKQLEAPDAAKLQSAIQRKKEAEATQVAANAAISQATMLVDKYELRAEGIEEINKVKDPRYRKVLTKEYNAQFNNRKLAKTEANAATFDAASKHTAEGRSITEFVADNPERWNALTSAQQQKLQEGTAVTTDLRKYNDIVLLPKDELAKVDPNEYVGVFSDRDVRALTKLVRTAKGGGSEADKMNAQVGRTIHQQTKAFVEWGAGKGKGQDPAKAEVLYQMADTAVRVFQKNNDGKLPSSKEFTDILNQLRLSHDVETPGMFWGTNTETLSLEDISSEDQEDIIEFLERAGKPVTSANIIAVHLQAQRKQ